MRNGGHLALQYRRNRRRRREVCRRRPGRLAGRDPIPCFLRSCLHGRFSVRCGSVSVLGWILYRRNARVFVELRLSGVMSGLFALLSIPVLIFILVYNYQQNSGAINATLNDVVTKTKQASIEEAEKSHQSGRSDARAARGNRPTRPSWRRSSSPS